MESSLFRELRISRLMVGTVQLGMDYGVANRTGKPSYETARDVIRMALDASVNCLDTAAAYGDSEGVIGRALEELGAKDRMIIATKIPSTKGNPISDEEADEYVEKSLIESLERLRLKKVSFCLMHWEEDFRHIESLTRLKAKGLVDYIGCSIDTPEAAARIIGSGLIDAIQLPTSILDGRFVRSGLIAEAGRRGIAVFIRSIFLQGLLLMPEDEIHPALSQLAEVRKILAGIARSEGITLAELAVRYVLSLDGMTSTVVGVESREQIAHNIGLFDNGPLDKSLVAQIEQASAGLPDEMLMPGKWPR